ncbi:MAG: hypothetical protein AB2A00_06730 [Myxococcota bacterium]
MNSRSAWKQVVAAGLAVATTGCLNQQIFGVYLGPQGGSGLVVRGVIPPGANCVFAAGGTAFMIEGEMELGDGQQNANQYVAVLDVENTLPNNAYKPGTQGAPNYNGQYGSNNTNQVKLIGAKVRYEYPKQPASVRARYANEPIEGLLTGTSTPATGNINTGDRQAVTAVILAPERALELFRDPTVKKAIIRPEGFQVIAYVSLEGVDGQGQRVTSNEMTFRLKLTQGRIKNCAAIDDACQTVAVGTVAERTGAQCFPDQDIEECTCDPQLPYCTGRCISTTAGP